MERVYIRKARSRREAKSPRPNDEVAEELAVADLAAEKIPR
jgi:hypothetical protein